MIRVGIGVHGHSRDISPDFVVALDRAVATAEQSMPQIKIDIVADAFYAPLVARHRSQSAWTFCDATDLLELQRNIFDDVRQAAFFISDYGLLHYRCIEAILGLYMDRGENVLIEASVAPMESPRRYNPHTLETAWCNRDRLLIPYAVYQRIGTFDRTIGREFEDVDFSWRAQSQNIKTLVHPGAWVHCTPTRSVVVKDELKALDNAQKSLLEKWRGEKSPDPSHWFAETRWAANDYWLAGRRW